MNSATVDDLNLSQNIMQYNYKIYIAVCPKTYPRLENGWLTCGDDRIRHSEGDELDYECAAGFVSPDIPLHCICDESTDPDNPAWNCGGVDFATTCQKSMC